VATRGGMERRRGAVMGVEGVGRARGGSVGSIEELWKRRREEEEGKRIFLIKVKGRRDRRGREEKR